MHFEPIRVYVVAHREETTTKAPRASHALKWDVFEAKATVNLGLTSSISRKT